VKIHKPYNAPNPVADKPYPEQALADKPLKAEQKLHDYTPTSKPKQSSVIGAIAEAITNTFTAPASKFKHACRKCKSEKLEVRFGKNYYFKCLSCDENNRIDATCPRCKNLLKIRKDRDIFFAECKGCGTSDLFHTNH